TAVPHRHVLAAELPRLDGLVHARRPAHVPVVLSREEVTAVLSRLSGPAWLMAALLYGAGLHLLDCLQLRVKADLARGAGWVELPDALGRKYQNAGVRLGSGRIRRAEVHWYEAHGVGRVKMKIKRFLD